MKNFARLLRFAWPYRLRFGLSLVCAGAVALLFFSELGAVYPLLHILFNNQNCQKWVAARVESLDADAYVAAQKLDELEALARFRAEGKPFEGDEFQAHLRALQEEVKSLGERIRAARDEELRRQVGGVGIKLPGPGDASADPELVRRERAVKARLDQIQFVAKPSDDEAIAKHRDRIARDEADAARWKGYYARILPFAERFLPSDSFRTLVLLLGLVMVGVAVKGFFLFCQEVLVAQIQHRSLFDIRNQFFRRTIALDLPAFSHDGTSELMARFTNDLESVSQGFNVLFSKIMREPLRVITCLSGALWLNWRLTVLALVLVPVSVVISYRAGKIMKSAVRRSLESMSSIYRILQETFLGIKVVKAFTTERRERRRFFLETKALYKKSVRVAMIDALSDPVLELIALSMVSIALLAGSYLVLNQSTYVDLGLFKLRLSSRPMGMEDLLTLYTMLGGIADPIRKLSNVHSKIQRAAAASD
ncbi:MAG: ABC transporter transmembrane domain-containing protein [Isosphaeraceae bacterium]